MYSGVFMFRVGIGVGVKWTPPKRKTGAHFFVLNYSSAPPYQDGSIPVMFGSISTTEKRRNEGGGTVVVLMYLQITVAGCYLYYHYYKLLIFGVRAGRADLHAHLICHRLGLLADSTFLPLFS